MLSRGIRRHISQDSMAIFLGQNKQTLRIGKLHIERELIELHVLSIGNLQPTGIDTRFRTRIT